MPSSVYLNIPVVAQGRNCVTVNAKGCAFYSHSKLGKARPLVISLNTQCLQNLMENGMKVS